MTITIHQASVPVFVQGLKGLKGVLASGFARSRYPEVNRSQGIYNAGGG